MIAQFWKVTDAGGSVQIECNEQTAMKMFDLFKANGSAVTPISGGDYLELLEKIDQEELEPATAVLPEPPHA